MTDSSPDPIVVSSTATVAVWQTLLRYSITAAGAVLTALGYTNAAGKVSALLLAVGPLAMLISAGVGAWETRRNNQKMQTMAHAAPNDVAVVK